MLIKRIQDPVWYLLVQLQQIAHVVYARSFSKTGSHIFLKKLNIFTLAS